METSVMMMTLAILQRNVILQQLAIPQQQMEWFA